jgi:hypothetical protein
MLHLATIAGVAAAAAAAHAHSAPLTGKVIDARTRRPLQRVLVHVEHQPAFAETDTSGSFTLSLPPGKHTISASLIGYATLRRHIDLTGAGPHELVLELSEGAGAFEEQVTVSGAMPEAAREAPGGSIVYGRDLQALRGVMLDDPLRAVHALPAATSTDDFYSEFAVRGSSFRHLGLVSDGLPSPYLIHGIHGATDGGSITMVNGEALGSASLLPGGYPQRTGRRLGAIVDLTTRDGNRDGFRGRAGLSGTSANVLVEGPLAGRRGAWIVSARRSYLDYLLERIDPDGSFGFGFSDALAKLTIDISPRHQLQLLSVFGRSLFDEDPDDLGVNDDALSKSRAWLSGATWRVTPGPRLSIAQRFYTTGMSFTNTSKTNAVLDKGGTADFGWRADVVFAPRPGWVAEFGGDIQRTQSDLERRRTLDNAAEPALLDDYQVSSRAGSAYGSVAARFDRLTLAPGVRVDRWRASGETAASPWITGELSLTSSTRLRAGAGVYRQFPALTELNGQRGNPALAAERARHVDLSLSQTLPGSVSVQVTAYVRDERDILRALEEEPRRLPTGAVALARADTPWQNRLSGRARGIETLIRRDAPSGLSGWIAYAYARHRYDDPAAGESFWSDHDQRHTFSAHALYRVSNRTSLGAKFRYGSNYPITGYLESTANVPGQPPLFGGRTLFYTIGDARNTLRLPAYARLDLRADRAMTVAGRRVTLFAEVANVLDRRNERNVPYSIDRSGRAMGVTDSLLPIVPSAGFVVEF